MRLAGTSDTGWIAVDLADLLRALTSLRESPTVQRLRDEAASEDPDQA